jgi:hypothetical protein
LTGAAISGPVHVLVEGIPSNYQLVNASGEFAGIPYLTVPGGIPAGTAVVLSLEFTRSSAGSLNFVTSVVQGTL